MANRNTTRDNVSVGEIFAINMGGNPGTKRYGAIGTNGKFASVNMDSGNLAFTTISGAKKNVIVVGSYDISVKFFPESQHVKMGRSDVEDDMIFTVGKGNNVYAHLGGNRDGEKVSLNLRSRDYAVGSGGGSVTVVGSYELKGQASA